MTPQADLAAVSSPVAVVVRRSGRQTTVVTVSATPVPAAPDDESKRRRVVKIVACLVALAVVLALRRLAGVDVWGWLTQLWDTVTEISFGYVILGCLSRGSRPSSPRSGGTGSSATRTRPVTFMPVLASYAPASR